MKITELRNLLKRKDVIEEINKHLWIESQKAGHSIGIERATDEWLKLYSAGWVRYHMPEKYKKATKKKDKKPAKKAAGKKAAVKKPTKKKVVKKVAKKTVKKVAKKK